MGTVLIGGLLSSLILTLFLVPVIYAWVVGVHREARRQAKRFNAAEHHERTPSEVHSRVMPFAST